MCHQEREAGGAGLCVAPCKDLQRADTVFVYAGINYILLLPVYPAYADMSSTPG